MKTNYKRDYIAETAAHYTHFPQTAQARKILDRNRNTLQSIADNVQDKMVAWAREMNRKNFLGGNIDLFT